MSQYRLAFHLTLACVIYVALLWTAQRLGDARRQRRCRRASARRAFALLVLVLVQIYLGALVAGLRAGFVYNTWPLIDGAFVPDAARLFFDHAGVAEFLREHADGAVRSPHGGLCDLDLARCCTPFDVRAHGEAGLRSSPAPSCLPLAVTLQAALGIATLLYARAARAGAGASGDGDAWC